MLGHLRACILALVTPHHREDATWRLPGQEHSTLRGLGVLSPLAEVMQLLPNLSVALLLSCLCAKHGVVFLGAILTNVRFLAVGPESVSSGFCRELPQTRWLSITETPPGGQKSKTKVVEGHILSGISRGEFSITCSSSGNPRHFLGCDITPILSTCSHGHIPLRLCSNFSPFIGTQSCRIATPSI